MKSIIQQYNDDKIAYEEAYNKLEIVRDTIKAKPTQPTRHQKYVRLDHSKDLFTDV